MINSLRVPGKSVSEKLLIKKGKTVRVIGAPKGYVADLKAASPDAAISEKPAGTPDLIQLFVSSEAELRDKLPSIKTLLPANGILWLTYPKGSSKSGADINRDTIREYAQTIGLETVSLVAVDDVWSALRLKPI